MNYKRGLLFLKYLTKFNYSGIWLSSRYVQETKLLNIFAKKYYSVFAVCIFANFKHIYKFYKQQYFLIHVSLLNFKHSLFDLTIFCNSFTQLYTFLQMNYKMYKSTRFLNLQKIFLQYYKKLQCL